MKQLFITDLDGTFLNRNGEVSGISAEIINEFTAGGGSFTFATARTASSAVKIMEKVNVNVPCILMNGVSIYDIPGKKYIRNEYFSAEAAAETAELFRECGVIPFMYKIEDEILYTYYYGFQSREMHEFFLQRGNTADRPFIKCESLDRHADGKTVYFSVQGDHSDLLRVTERLDRIRDVSYAFYRDVYNQHIWFLEVFSSKASKSNGVKFIKEYCGFEHITCFGDNLNDLPMFGVCDHKIAVSNAKAQVLSAADEIIGSNQDNAVAFHIKEYMK
ncbi:MAG: HAD-IIB family hydrolase [Porcipelethomonas sp.]